MVSCIAPSTCWRASAEGSVSLRWSAGHVMSCKSSFIALTCTCKACFSLSCCCAVAIAFDSACQSPSAWGCLLCCTAFTYLWKHCSITESLKRLDLPWTWMGFMQCEEELAGLCFSTPHQQLFPRMIPALYCHHHWQQQQLIIAIGNDSALFQSLSSCQQDPSDGQGKLQEQNSVPVKSLDLLVHKYWM